MRIATIDIGTNTVLLLVADVEEREVIRTLVYEQRVPRLGAGVDARRALEADAIARVTGVLSEYREFIERHAAEAVAVCGTSAVRDASNRDVLAARIRNETGFELEVLTGEDEAHWTYVGARSGLPGTGRTTVIDIGGGSTEITLGGAQEIEARISLDIGSVRLTERCFRHDPPTPSELETAIEIVENEIDRAARFPFTGSTLVGVAGTATTLAILAQGLRSFDVRAVTNFHLTREATEELFRRLRSMPSAAIRDLSNVMEGRHDVIVAGSLILREILAHFRFDELVVSERGLRYGLAIREWERRHRR